MTDKLERRLRRIAIKRLAKFDDPLIRTIINWIKPEELWSALEEAGLVQAKLVDGIMAPKDFAKMALDALSVEHKKARIVMGDPNAT